MLTAIYPCENAAIRMRTHTYWCCIAGSGFPYNPMMMGMGDGMGENMRRMAFMGTYFTHDFFF